MFDEPLSRGGSFIHRLDPRVRVACAMACAIGLAALQHPAAAACGLLLAVLLLALARPPWLATLKRLAAVNVFILFMWLTVPAAMPGEALWSFGLLSFSRAGVGLMLLITLKCNALVILLMALVASMNTAVLGAALARLRFPSKLAFMLLFAYRYVHVAAAEWRTLKTAAALRGFAPRADMHTYRTIGYLLGMTFVRGLDRAARVSEAMLLRGFSGRFTSLAIFRASGADAAFAAGFAVALSAIICGDIYLGAFGG